MHTSNHLMVTTIVWIPRGSRSIDSQAIRTGVVDHSCRGVAFPVVPEGPSSSHKFEGQRASRLPSS